MTVQYSVISINTTLRDYHRLALTSTVRVVRVQEAMSCYKTFVANKYIINTTNRADIDCGRQLFSSQDTSRVQYIRAHGSTRRGGWSKGLEDLKRKEAGRVPLGFWSAPRRVARARPRAPGSCAAARNRSRRRRRTRTACAATAVDRPPRPRLQTRTRASRLQPAAVGPRRRQGPDLWATSTTCLKFNFDFNFTLNL